MRLTTFRGCVGNCAQGRSPCVTPEACLPPLDIDLSNIGADRYPIGCPEHLRHPTDADPHLGWGAFLPAFLAVALVGACAALALLMAGTP